MTASSAPKKPGLLDRLRRQLAILQVELRCALLRPAYARAWAPLREKYAGKRAFLIGNGPSLNQTPLYLLHGEETLCFNRFSLMLERLDWTPAMYMVVDGVVGADIAADIALMRGKVRDTFLTRFALSTGLDFGRFVPEAGPPVHWMLPRRLHSPFDFQLPMVNPGGSVAIAGLQVLRYLGFREIVLLGIDMNQTLQGAVTHGKPGVITAAADNDPNHFDPRYFGQGRTYHEPDARVIGNILSSFERISQDLAASGCRVVNASPGSAVTSYPKVDLVAYLGLSPSEVRDRFERSFAAVTGLDFRVERPNAVREGDASTRLIAVPVAEASRKVGGLISTHLPLGPYDGDVYCIARSALRVPVAGAVS